MRTPAPVGEVERQSPNRALEALREEWGFVSSYALPELLKSWVRTVASLRKGYPLARISFEHAVDLRDSAEQHRRIYQAIRARDPEKARQAMSEHLTSAQANQAAEESERGGDQPWDTARERGRA